MFNRSPRRILSTLVRSTLGAIALLFTTACAVNDRHRPIPTPMPFDTYRQETISMLQQQRAFQTIDTASEITWNAPQEWRPAGHHEKGILLVHGLGDSPWSFQDLGATLAAQGFLVRTILLPGHGTRPEDMLDITLENWQQVVAEQTQQLHQEVDQVYLGGFSTGANLILDYAYAHPDIKGLLLASPAFKSNSAYDWLTPLISWARPWLRAPDNTRPKQNAVRYMNMPTNGLAQFYRSSKLARHALRNANYDKPVLMVVAEHDSVLDTVYLREMFTSRFTHPASRLIWYGATSETPVTDSRILTRTDKLPELRISQFSHMGILFSPQNTLYGMQGSLRLCWNGQTAIDRADCEGGTPVWYSDWGYNEPGKFHARLTFNPYFDWQNEVMAEVFSGSTRQLP